MLHFAESRTLTEYPRGAHRWTLLLLTVLAAVLTGYEFQLAPILPLLLPYLHMSHILYSYYITFSVLVGAISAFFGGPLADRYGRVMILDACLAIITVLVFANLLIVGIKSFLAIRLLMALVAGLARAQKIAEATGSFVYLVALTGVTGARGALPPDIAQHLRMLRGVTAKPVCVGFGIGSADQAAAIGRLADGVIVGSAIVSLIERHAGSPDLVSKVGDFVAALKAPLREPTE